MNLLVDPLFTVERPDGSQGGLSLPGLLRALGAGDPVELAQLRPHQEQPVLAFLVQLGALVLSRGGGDVERSEEAWRRGLLDLSGGSGEAWELEVEDPRSPAFMQPPMGPALAAKMKSAPPLEFAPDAAMFEVLVTTRAFDVQPGKLRGAGAEHWAFSLVTLQTSQGYSGRGHYGAARLAGPFASRAFVGRTPSDRLAPRFRRDVEVWLPGTKALNASRMVLNGAARIPTLELDCAHT
jgi:CRISPR system Cascade subunit CasA